jgi:hypothetical protein
MAGENLYRLGPNIQGWIDPLGLHCGCIDQSGNKTLASKLADKVQKMPSSKRPNTVAVIQTKGGQIVIGRNQGGITNPELQSVLKNIPPNEFDGQCAEINAISRALNKGLDLDGAEITVANVRGPASTTGTHGTAKNPCSVCQKVLDYFGIKNGNPK